MALVNQKDSTRRKRSNEETRLIWLVDPQLELTDPTPDIYEMFANFNVMFFENKLGVVTVDWSPRMTQCAGVCSFNPGSGGCCIRLSRPLLSLRPRRDLVETLLHEMIHAFLFVGEGNREREEHGPKFKSIMYNINELTGTNITVYHSFRDEVDHFRTHWWKCNGPCQQRSPFFGIVKRSMNRAPGPNDNWYGDHQRTCGGQFTKIKEPEPKKKPLSKRKAEEAIAAVGTKPITDFFARPTSSVPKTASAPKTASVPKSSFVPKAPSASKTVSPSKQITDFFAKPTSTPKPSNSQGERSENRPPNTPASSLGNGNTLNSTTFTSTSTSSSNILGGRSISSTSSDSKNRARKGNPSHPLLTLWEKNRSK